MTASEQKSKVAESHTEHIRRFHELNRRLAAARASGAPTAAALEAELSAMGGLPAYQHASRVGERKHGATNTSRWVVRLLQERRAAAGDSARLRLLDVGAVTLNYTRERGWIDCRAIDLHASGPGIEAMDFMALPCDAAECVFDVVVLSLVLNFVGDAAARGDMVYKAARHHLPVGGMLVVVLPLACVDNARFCDEATLTALLAACGLQTLRAHRSKSLFYAAYTLERPAPPTRPAFSRRQVIIIFFFLRCGGRDMELCSFFFCNGFQQLEMPPLFIPIIFCAQVRRGEHHNNFCII